MLVIESCGSNLDKAEMSLPPMKPEPPVTNIRDTKDNLAIIIPVFNEHQSLLTTVSAIQSHPRLEQTFNQVHLCIVDDGSTQPISASFKNKTQWLTIHLLRHAVNLGQGAALQTGISYALELEKAHYFVTMDADGQHNPADLLALLAPVMHGQADIVFGNRFATKSNVPMMRKLVLKLAIKFEQWLTGLNLRDAHNGYRAFSRFSASKIRLEQNRMAHATEFKLICKKTQLRVSEVPVAIRYSDETLSKGQSSLGAIKIMKDLITHTIFGRTT